MKEQVKYFQVYKSPNRKGYEFDGWHLRKRGGEKRVKELNRIYAGERKYFLIKRTTIETEEVINP